MRQVRAVDALSGSASHVTNVAVHAVERATSEVRAQAPQGPRRVDVVRSIGDIGKIFRSFERQTTLWCRARFGTGSVGATTVRTEAQARAWVTYWADMRGVPARQFTLSEYLPGRDFACQSLWMEGQLVLIKTTERISYFRGESGPTGLSMSPCRSGDAGIVRRSPFADRRQLRYL